MSARRIDALLKRLRQLRSVVVAFSGGVDSALVLAAATRALDRDSVVAATAISPSLATSELTAAKELSAALGVRHLTPHTAELQRDGYQRNLSDRCYFCKSEVLDVLQRLAGDMKFCHVATGTNADDAVDPFRPGIRAGDERGVVTPLRDEGLTKNQVREISRAWGLPTWDKPASPCLSSRIAYGVRITKDRLSRVEKGEAFVRRLLLMSGVQFRNIRVRDLDRHVRVEIDADAVEHVRALPDLPDVLRAAGFIDLPVHVGPFRSGALNYEIYDQRT